jgi:hypothetical protein
MIAKVIIIIAIAFFGLILTMLIIPALLARRARRFRMKANKNTENDYHQFKDEGNNERRKRTPHLDEKLAVGKQEALVLPGFLPSAYENKYKRHQDSDEKKGGGMNRKSRTSKKKPRSSTRSTRTRKKLREFGEKQRPKSRKTRVYTSE